MVDHADNGTTLVVGSDSLVGRAYCEFLSNEHKPVIGTSRRANHVDPPSDFPRVHLDLADDLTNWAVPENTRTAVLCAGITKFAVCKSDPEATSLVNVYGISSLAESLMSLGVRIVYLSTAVVFDGLIPNRGAEDKTCPLTEYGRQNANAESALQNLSGSLTILRLTKTIGPNMPLLDEWAQALITGQAIHPYSDLTMAPIPLSHAIDALNRVVMEPINGILQASGNLDITYAEAATYGASVLDADPDLVRPLTASQESKFTEPVPYHTTLDSGRLESEYGLKSPDVWNTLQEYFARLYKPTRPSRIDHS